MKTVPDETTAIAATGQIKAAAIPRITLLPDGFCIDHLYCPFGAHIRRTNPRGSLAPGDDSQLMITNRHRLLRRGRSYQQRGGGRFASRKRVKTRVEPGSDSIRTDKALANSRHGKRQTTHPCIHLPPHYSPRSRMAKSATNFDRERTR